MKQRGKLHCCSLTTIIFAILLLKCPRGNGNASSVECFAPNDSGECVIGSKNCDLSSCAENMPVNTENFKSPSESLENCKALYKYQSYIAAAGKPKVYHITSKKVPYEYNPYFFQLELDWASWEEAQGYYISINIIAQDGEENPPTPKLYSYRCIKAQPTDRMNLTLFMEYSSSLGYSDCSGPTRYFEVSVIGLPTNPNHGSPSYSKVSWPANCFDIVDDESICGPHSPAGIQISTQTYSLPNTTSLMSALVTWNNPSNTIFTIAEYQIRILNSHNFQSTSFMYSLNSLNTSTDTRSLIFSPLNNSATYYIYLYPFQEKICQYECPNKNGAYRRVICGQHTTISFSYTPPSLPSPSPLIDPSQLTTPNYSLSYTPFISSQFSSLIISPTLFTSNGSSLAENTNGHHYQPLSKYYMEIMIGIGVIVFIVIILVIVLIGAVVKTKYNKRITLVEGAEDILKSSSESSAPSTATSTRSPTPISPSPLPLSSSVVPSTYFTYDNLILGDHSPYQGPGAASGSSYYQEPVVTLPVYYQEPHPDNLPPNLKLVLVVESIHVSDEYRQAHQLFLGCDLGRCQGVRVLHYNHFSRKPPSGWLMAYMSKADMVLCVCTAEFLDEWKHIHEHSLVHPLRDYIIGSESTGRSLSDKYLTLTHSKEDMKYIPEELKSVRHFIINSTDTIYRTITQTPKEVVV